MPRVEVHKAYMDRFETISEAACKISEVSFPQKPLKLSAFARYCGEGHPTLRVQKVGLEFCDLCTSTKIDLHNLDRNHDKNACLTALLERRKDAALQDRDYRRRIMRAADGIFDSST